MKQKYQKGQRVKVVIGHPIWSAKTGWVDIRPELIEDFATVEHTYGEMSETDFRFSNGEQGYKEYSLKFDKYGSIAWFNENVITPV